MLLGLLAIFVLIFTWIYDCVSAHGGYTGSGYIHGGKPYSRSRSQPRKHHLLPVQVVIGDITARVNYQDRVADPKTLHIGQRKLLMNEIQFLTDISDARPLIVYAGAAPGNKTGYLSGLFPNMVFLLVDPNHFDIFDADPMFLPKDNTAITTMVENINTPTRIFIINDIYTCELSRELAAVRDKYTSIRFISDIRTATDDINILWNHAQQYNWIQLLKPESAMLKFRMPYYLTPPAEIASLAMTQPYATDFANARETGFDPIADVASRTMTYFAGEIRLQPWAPLSSTETRLIVTKIAGKYPMTMYTNAGADSYENIMHGYNTVERTRGHVNDNANLRIGFDHCNDCALENLIWKRYIAARGGTKSVQDHVRAISALTHRSLLRDKHGSL